MRNLNIGKLLRRSGVKKSIRSTASFRRHLFAGISCSLISVGTAAEVKFQDPLDTPAATRISLASRPFQAIAHAGTRIVAVGSRGLIVGSDDGGKAWNQAKVPVQTDLLAVNFPTPVEGWAVGHNGVVLHSTDGGKSWVKQLDGRTAAESFKAYYATHSDIPEAGSALSQLEQNFKAGPALPYLDVWFESPQKGFAVGSFGLIIATSDGGKTWEPWLHRIDNPQSLNLNAVRGIGNDVFIVGERGQIYRLDRSKDRFERTDTGYIGSFFGITGNPDVLIAYGLRGTVYRAARVNGMQRWEPVPMPNEQTITAGVTQGDGFVLANGAGQFLISDRSGKRFLVKSASKPSRLTGLVTLNSGAYAVTALDGVRTEALNSDKASER